MFSDMMTNGNKKLVLKDSKMAIPGTEDMGFCSGEDYLENEIHSPTDSSEDSVEVKVSLISLKNKRKLVEPRKVPESFTGPLKKRMCLKVKAENEINAPFRPWSPPQSKPVMPSVPILSNNFVVPFPVTVKSEVKAETTPATPYFRPPSPVKFYQQTEPVSLVIKRENKDLIKADCDNNVTNDIRVPIHPQITKLSTAETERIILKTNEHFPALQSSSSSDASPTLQSSRKTEQRREQRNYKNMTRERRIEANARERTRVHTISAAFDTLRQSVPAYSHNQKLSKLSVLRIACSYIMTLSSIVGNDEEQSTSECVDMVSKTIQREGKLRKKKDDND